MSSTSPCYALVDSGTTTTRVRIWRDGRVVWSESRSVGAKDTAVDGSTARVAAALRELLDASGAEPGAIICSGMITSNMGLFELPHLSAPASPEDIARGMVQRHLPEISDMPLTFVPGVKTLPGPDGLAGLPSGDVLRGEEAEIAGLRHELGLNQASVFLHIGSHHKAIDVGADGSILASRTAITGELLAAVAGQTILRSSVVPLEQVDASSLDITAVRAGWDAAREHGFGRALFLVRVGEQLAGRSREAMTSYLLGVLASLDLPLLAGVAPTTPVIVYGSGAFPRILGEVLPERGYAGVRVVAPEVADMAAAAGAVRLFESRS